MSRTLRTEAKGHFLVLTAFLDESYDKEIFVVAGFFSYEDDWRRLEKRWKATLRENRIKRFHAADCNSGFGEFSGWTAKRRTGLMKRLLRFIVEQEMYGIYSGVVQPAFRAEFRIRTDDEAYPLCLQHCLEIIGEKTVRLPATEKVKIIVDSSRFASKGADVFHFMKTKRGWQHGTRLHSITFSSWREFIPLQCADLMAYETFKMLRRTEVEPHRSERKSFSVLARLPIFGGHFDQTAMRQLKDALSAEESKYKEG
ncbi:MAG: DUF3800 domain-containing protein [Acidobacteriia bacterium]|nr:DUF3800 domain-containing protein [Terriglobia bacterium]